MFKKILISLYLLACASAQSAERQLTLYASSSTPPYVISESDNGIAVDIIRAAFASKGYSVKFLLAPNRRVEKQLLDRSADGAYNMPPQKLADLFYSQPVLYYDDVIVSLKSSPAVFTTINDLIGKKIVAFQNAPKFLGEPFAQVVASDPLGYSEVGDQELQLRMLYAGRADAIVLERNIFLYYFHKKKAPPYPVDSYQIHPVFPKVPIYAAFVSKNVRDDFDDGLDAIKKSGEYKRIFDSYLGGP